jgi:1-acyl-sn-glycerol-3-phosphate acyltransferase
MDFLLRICFVLFGWKVQGNVPKEIKKGIFVVAPHCTWIDFMIGLCVRATLRLNIGFIGKSELFRPPFGFMFRALGGTPAYRTSNNNMVESYVKAINEANDMLFAVAPEGTRKNVEKLRSGFYFMALGANIPIVPVGFDFPRKMVVIGKPFFASGDFEDDMKTIFVPFFETIGGIKKKWIENYKRGKFN